MNNWYDDPKTLANAIGFIRQFSCMYNWTVFATTRQKTPCCDYAAEDKNIPDGLKNAIRRYYRNLSKSERREINKELALLLSERFFVREDALILVYSRILSDGDPRENKNMIRVGLQLQIRQRMELMEKLA